MSRKNARDLTFKILFSFLFNEAMTFDDFLIMEDVSDCPEEDSLYIKSTYLGVKENFPYLKQLISENLKDYELERVYKVDLAILLYATYELVYSKDLSVSIIVNEAVNISKKYSTEKSPTFINGVLSSIVRNVR